MSHEKLDSLSDLSKEEYFCMKEAFKMFDFNFSGQLSVKDIRKALVRFNNGRRRVTDKDVVKVMDKIDKDNNGAFDFYEFVELIMQIEKEGEDYYTMLFEQFDFQNRGVVTPHSLLKSLQAFNIKITHEEARKIISRFDDEKKGSLDMMQFKRLMDIYEEKKCQERKQKKSKRRKENFDY